MMSRKDYEMVALRLAGELAINGDNESARTAVRGVIYVLGDMFAGDNPRFNRERFYQACGLCEYDDSDGTWTEDDQGNWNRVK